MPIQEQEQQDRRNAIIKYITENEGCTKTQVIDYLKGRSAVVTTHKIITKLIEEKTVLVQPDSKNRQTHHLHINDKLKIIDEQLNKIKELMDLMNHPIRMWLRLQDPPASNDKELLQTLEDSSEKPTNFSDIDNHFIYPYEEAVFMMLRVLFVEISETILSEKDKQLLLRRIVILMIRLSAQIYNVTKVKDYFSHTIRELKDVQFSNTKAFAKKNRIDMGLRKNIIETIQDFESKFLPITK